MTEIVATKVENALIVPSRTDHPPVLGGHLVLKEEEVEGDPSSLVEVAEMGVGDEWAEEDGISTEVVVEEADPITVEGGEAMVAMEELLTATVAKSGHLQEDDLRRPRLHNASWEDRAIVVVPDHFRMMPRGVMLACYETSHCTHPEGKIEEIRKGDHFQGTTTQLTEGGTVVWGLTRISRQVGTKIVDQMIGLEIRGGVTTKDSIPRTTTKREPGTTNMYPETEDHLQRIVGRFLQVGLPHTHSTRAMTVALCLL